MARRKVIIALLVLLVAGQVVSAQRGGRPAGAGGQDAPAAAPEVPIIGLAGIGFRVSDLTKARGYYQGVLGFAEAFSTKDQSGRVASSLRSRASASVVRTWARRASAPAVGAG
jgi:hypothetical protein